LDITKSYIAKMVGASALNFQNEKVKKPNNQISSVTYQTRNVGVHFWMKSII